MDSNEQQPTANTSSPKILIVDDDKFLLEMYALKFKSGGFEIDTCADPEEALTKIKGGATPDVFLFDLIMPKLNGLELLKQIKDAGLIPNALKIVLSNQGQQTDIDAANEIGVDGYIVKALYTPSEVLAQVKKILANKKS